ncbi:MAG: hypothetical protein WA951_05990 [Leeuwenhoekiella sp.]
MKEKIVILLLSIIQVSQVWAQVGVGTVEPEADLHVKGNTLIQEGIQLGSLPFVQPEDSDFKLITRITNSEPRGKVAVLDVDSLEVAPVNVINYTFTGISSDNLTDVNLQYDADKYIVGLANFRYVGDPINKRTLPNNTISVGAFVTRTFINNNTWHLEIRNRFLNLAAGKSLVYHVTLIVYDKSYYRNLPEIVTDLGGRNTGTASAQPNLY